MNLLLIFFIIIGIISIFYYGKFKLWYYDLNSITYLNIAKNIANISKNIAINILISGIIVLHSYLIIQNESTIHCGDFYSTYNMYLPCIFIIITYLIFVNIKKGHLIKPFSNTFGYLYSIFFLNNIFEKLLIDIPSDDENLKRLMQLVRDKPTICINEFTPYNFTDKIKEYDFIIQPGIYLGDFKDGVKKKFLFSEFIFLSFFIAINSLWTKNEILNTKCKVNNSIKNHTTSLTQSKSNLKSNLKKKKKKVYNIN